MNRRDFIKTTSAAAVTATSLSSFGEESLGTQTGTTLPPELKYWRWDFRVYCYERQQGQWIFSENIRGSFAPEREYVSVEEEATLPYAGWMDKGKLHFVSLEEAQDFVDMHVRTKDDTNLIDHIYDIYYIQRGVERVEVADTAEDVETEREIKVAHYWFNGDTGRQINWVAEKPYTDWSKVESS